MIYLIGSLRNPEIPNLANKLEESGHEVFADWFAAGHEADDKWRDYEKARGKGYLQALEGYAAKNVFAFDHKHLMRADTVVLAAPAGKSGHLEFGWALGQGKKGYYLLDDPERWDVMLQFATGVYSNVEKLVKELKRIKDESDSANSFRGGPTEDLSRRAIRGGSTSAALGR